MSNASMPECLLAILRHSFATPIQRISTVADILSHGSQLIGQVATEWFAIYCRSPLYLATREALFTFRSYRFNLPDHKVSHDGSDEADTGPFL